MNADFDDDVDGWVRAGIRAGATSFDDLICHLPGVYPTDAVAALDRLVDRDQITVSEHRRGLARRLRVSAPAPITALPVPHPLDFDWRFTAEALDVIVAASAASGDGVIACLVS